MKENFVIIKISQQTVQEYKSIFSSDFTVSWKKNKQDISPYPVNMSYFSIVS